MTTCGACGRSWGGKSMCHCGRCHRHFGGLKAFDAHIRVVSLSDEAGDNEATCTDPRPRKGVEWFQDESGTWKALDPRFASPVSGEAQTHESGASRG